MHKNSIRAHTEQKDAGKRTRLIVEVLNCIQDRPRWNGGLTDREIMKRLGFTDMNAVRPRITELIDRGIVEECGDVKDSVTGMTVRLVRLKKTQPQGELF